MNIIIIGATSGIGKAIFYVCRGKKSAESITYFQKSIV